MVTHEGEVENQIDDLPQRILKDIKASKDLGLLRCVQCGMCTSTCPAARHSEYDPRVVIKRVLDNDQTILSEDYIWNCFYCYNCQSICPVGNSVCEVNQILRQMAIDEDVGKRKIVSFMSFADSFLDVGLGVIPKEYHGQLRKDYKQTWIDLQENLEDIRDFLGLDKMNLYPEAEAEIDKTLEAIGFKERVKQVKAVDKKKEDDDEEGGE